MQRLRLTTVRDAVMRHMPDPPNAGVLTLLVVKIRRRLMQGSLQALTLVAQLVNLEKV